jgi:hypothetical protein
LRKVKAFKKRSMRERRRLEGAAFSGKDVSFFGRERLSSSQRLLLDRTVDRFIRGGSCRHGRALGVPCVSFDSGGKGACKEGGGICDLLTEKGEKYLRQYEDD